MSQAIITKLQEADLLIRQGKAQQALQSLQRVLQTRGLPNNLKASCYSLSAWASNVLGKVDQAEFLCRQAVALAPKDPQQLSNLAVILINHPRDPIGKRREAEQILRQVLTLDPTNINAHVGLANILLELRRTKECLDVCERAARLNTDQELILTHSKALSITMGRQHEGLALLEKGAAKFPQDPRYRMSLAAMLGTMPGVTPKRLADEHAAFGRLIERKWAPLAPVALAPSDAERPLKVGVLSADLRTHSVAFFMEPIFALLDKDRFSLHAYHNNINEDAISDTLRAHCASWKNVAFETEPVIAQQIRADTIDVLIDCTGLTNGQRLGVFAMRPAPLQLTYCGYPDTTGLTRIDARIVDSQTDPPKSEYPGTLPDDPPFDARATETLVRLDPCFLCYSPPPDAPAPRRNERDTIAFGSFNAARKINAPLAALWARVLLAVPGSRLFLKSLDTEDTGVRDGLRALFEPHGVADRVVCLEPTLGIAPHLATYAQIDIALDSLPYNGTTTTCEALWMGVPVVTRAGDRHAARVGASLLSAVGLPDLIARDDDDFVAIATRLAHDPARLAAWRTTLREQMARSPLCDRPAFARRFGDSLRTLWRARCGAGKAS